MSVRYQIPADGQRALAERLFVAIRGARTLMAGRGESAAPRIGLDRLYAYAVDPGLADPGLERALATDRRLSADFRRLLERTATRRLPRVAAASSDAVRSREAEGCRIRFQQSSAEPDQTYVIIELDETAPEAPANLFIVYPDGGCRKFALPVARNGIIQILIERESDVLAGLLDLDTEVFLK